MSSRTTSAIRVEGIASSARGAAVWLVHKGVEKHLNHTVGRTVNSQGRELFVDPSDWRGRQLFIKRGSLDRVAIALWREVVQLVRPTIVLDVGCNYGEVVLSGDYPDSPTIICVEPNERVARYLRSSLDSGLPGARLMVAAAGSSSGHTYFVNDAPSSGLGHVVPAVEPGAVRVAVVAGDDLVRATAGDRVVFKVDVEGNEMSVLDGLQKTFQAAAATAGVVEFFHLAEGDQQRLVRSFDTFAVAEDLSRYVKLDEQTLPRYFPRAGSVLTGFAKDVLVVSGDAKKLREVIGSR
jgi:FkbM family methyltransferase